MSKNGVISAAESNAVRDGLLRIGAWQIGPALPPDEQGVTDFADIAVFASGKSANNKLIADMPLQKYSEAMRVSEEEFLDVRTQALDAFDILVDAYGEPPDTLWGIASGGQDYARALAERRGLQFVELAKVRNDPGIKTYRPATPDDAKKLRAARYMMGFEDAGNEATSPYGALFESDENGLNLLREKTIGFNFLWVRGNLQKFKNPRVQIPPLRAVVRERIPNRIRSSDSFYRRFGHLAVPYSMR